MANAAGGQVKLKDKESPEQGEQRKDVIQREILTFLMNELYTTPPPKTIPQSRSPVTTVNTNITHVECTEMKDTDYTKEGETIDGRFKIIGKLREGGFGQIYKAHDLKMKTDVALKMEAIEEGHPNVEGYILAKFQFCQHCPRLFGAGTLEKKCHFVAMQLLGKNLSELRRACALSPARLSVGTTNRLVSQCLQSVEALHSLGFIHRDIKPSNFAMGCQDYDHDIVYMLDFGLSRYYLAKDGTHRPYRENVGFRGTVRYASLNTHDYKEQSRRDDMWCLFYAYFELMTGKIPWRKSNDAHVVADAKRHYTPEIMSTYMPPECAEFVQHIRVLNFEDTPAYKPMSDCLLNALPNYHTKMTDPFDWQVAPDCKELMHWKTTKKYS